VWVENGSLIFTAEIISDTEEVIYLEGVWVNPSARGQGLGLLCMSELARHCLLRTKSLCLLVNEKNAEALLF